MKGRATAGASVTMPELIEPMLAGSGGLPASDDWAVEFAWEGLRVIAYARPNRLKLLTVTGRQVTSTFPDLDEALTSAAPLGGIILDGTVVARQENGLPRRRALQSRSGTTRPSEALIRRVPVGFLAGDVLWHDGRSTVELPFQERRRLLDAVEFDRGAAWSSPSFPVAELAPVMVAAEQHGVDALYARQVAAPYRPGKRSRYLLRLPVRRIRQVVVGGWSPAGPHRPDSIGALLLGVPEEAGLRYVGRAGLRSTDDRRAVADVLPQLRRGRSPFSTPLPAEIAEHAGWMAPQLVGRVEFADSTPDGRLRLPVWRGLVPADQVDAGLFVEVPEPGGPATTAPAAEPVDEPGPPGISDQSPVTPDHRTDERRLEQHFFYNALNTIASVIRSDPGRARDLLLGFADLNRAADQPTGTPTTLGAELTVVRAYLELEQARFGKRLQVRIDVDASLHELLVAPLSLLDAVRTTVQERIEPRPGGGTLVLTAAPRTGECVIQVADETPHITVAISSASP